MPFGPVIIEHPDSTLRSFTTMRGVDRLSLVGLVPPHAAKLSLKDSGATMIPKPLFGYSAIIRLVVLGHKLTPEVYRSQAVSSEVE